MRSVAPPPETRWTSPSILLTIAAMGLATFGSYQATLKDNSKQVSALESDVAALKERVAALKERVADQCRRPPG